MGLGKNGVFFTLTVIAAASLFLVGYTFYTNFGDRSITHERISTLNTFMFSIEENLERQIFISGFRALFIIQTEAVQKGEFIVNATESFNDLFFAGSFKGGVQPIMIGATFSDIQDIIQQNAAKVNAEIYLANPEVHLAQSDPWHVDVVLTVDLNARDQGGLVTWNKTEVYVAKVPIKDFEDPLYLINTNGQITNKMEQTPFSSFSVSNLNNHTVNGYYRASPNGPSYLQRLQGINSTDPNGVESLVYIPQLSNQGITTFQKSVVDHIYFSGSDPVACQITGMPSWFRLDASNVVNYGLSGLEHSCL